MIWDDGRADDSEFPPVNLRDDLSVEALISTNFIQTNSVVYRRLPRYDDIPPDVMPLDWYLHVRHALGGRIAMLPETMSVYRRHSHGIFYQAVAAPAEFWAKGGHGFAALFEAMLDLFPGDRHREKIVVRLAYWLVAQITTVPGPEGRIALLDTVAQHPRLLRRHAGQRMLVMLALQYQRAHTVKHRLKILWRKVAHRNVAI